MPKAVYENFDLLIVRLGDHYQARVINSPVGEATGEFTLPFLKGEWRSFFQQMSARHLTYQPSNPEGAAKTPSDPQVFGERLFQAVFTGNVGKLLVRSYDQAINEGKGLRLRLRLDKAAPELAELPWEYLYVPDWQRFPALSDETPLVRYIELSESERPLQATLPLQILAVVANPQDVPPLEVELEWTRLQNAIADLQARELIRLERLTVATLEALQDRLRQGSVHLLHFIGHGYFNPANSEGGLVFEDAKGMHQLIAADKLATLLHDHRTLRLAFLNACEGARSSPDDVFAGVAQQLVQQGIPAVLAMQFAVSDSAAITLAHEFYQAIADGYPVDAAVSEARKAVYTAGNELEWGTPVLFSRSPDGVVIDLSGNQGESQMSETKPAPWWEQLSAAGTGITGLDATSARGDVIIANVGAGAKNVAVGKNITQRIYEVLGEPTPSDKQIIEEKLAEVADALTAKQGELDAVKAQMAQFQLQLLQGELTKVEEEEKPSASTIVQIGNWLLDNIPQLVEALTSLFVTPAVGRVIGKAGETAVTWVKARFGR